MMKSEGMVKQLTNHPSQNSMNILCLFQALLPLVEPKKILDQCLQIYSKYGELKSMENAYHLAKILIVFQLSPSFLPKLIVVFAPW